MTTPSNRFSAVCSICRKLLPKRSLTAHPECRRRCACGRALLAKTKGDECRRCKLQRAETAKTCGCGRRKDDASTLCRLCYRLAMLQKRAIADPRLVAAWNPDAFRAEVDRLGWSYQALADVSGVSIATIWTWLAGEHWPRLEQFQRVCTAMGQDVCRECEGTGRVSSGISAELLIAEWSSRRQRRAG